MAAILVLTTVGTEQEANQIAEELLERRHAACVNIISGVRSVYRWKGSICKDSEYLLIIKTMSEEYDLVAAAIGELHSYELPEILAFPIDHGDPGFLGWINECLDKEIVYPEDEDLDAVEQE